MLLCVQAVVLAKDKEAAQPAKATAQESKAQQQKELLITNINNMRAQEIRVAVLQQLFNEEIAKLKNLQESFCKQYKLDIEKFRKGLYRYDDVQGKFVEVKETKP
jgi:hypothetical protein